MTPLDRLFAAGYEFDFFQAVRVLERAFPDKLPVGRDKPRPRDEAVRFRALPALSFPASSVYEVLKPDFDHPAARMTVAFLGLTGPSGVLPTHYTQLLMDLERDVRGPERRALRDWLDLFNHRLVSLFFRAWEKYRLETAYLRGEAFGPDPDPLTGGLFALVGVGTPALRNRLEVRTPPEPVARVDDLALLRYAGLFAQTTRNAVGLEAVLGDYFDTPVAVEQFRGRWLALDPSDQTRLGFHGRLGIDAIAGDKVWDVQGRFRVRVGPVGYSQFREFLPDRSPVPRQKALFLLSHLARLYAGPGLDFDVQLVLAAAEVPATALAGTGRLGWDTWLVTGPPARDADDAVFEGDDRTGLG